MRSNKPPAYKVAPGRHRNGVGTHVRGSRDDHVADIDAMDAASPLPWPVRDGLAGPLSHIGCLL